MFMSITMFWVRLGRLILARAVKRGLRWALRRARSKFRPKNINTVTIIIIHYYFQTRSKLFTAWQRWEAPAVIFAGFWKSRASSCSRSLVMTILRCRCDLSRKSTVGIIVAKQEWARYKGIAYLGDNKQRVALLIFKIQRATDSNFPMVIAYRKVAGLWTRWEKDKRIKISDVKTKQRFYGLMPSLCRRFLF